MLQIIDHDASHIWPNDCTLSVDAMAALSLALAPAWDVEREIDPAGNVSIVVFTASDDPTLPAFMLYEKDGHAVVATVRDDVWVGEQRFASREHAVAAVVADVTRGETLPGTSGQHQLEHCL
jgi:hypothetical protein